MNEVTGRDPNNGRFTVGNPGGPGRPSREKEAAILAALRDEFSPVELAQGLRRAFELAEKQGSSRGMVAALTPFLEYTLGKPVVRVETSSDNPMQEKFEEWKRARLEAMRQLLEEQAQAQPVEAHGIRVVEDAQVGQTEV